MDRELSDGMGVDLDLGGFVAEWGSDGRNTGLKSYTCGCMRMNEMRDAWH